MASFQKWSSDSIKTIITVFLLFRKIRKRSPIEVYISVKAGHQDFPEKKEKILKRSPLYLWCMPLNSVNHNDLFIGTHTQNSPISGFSNGNEPESSFYFIPKKRVTTSLDIWFF